MKIETKLNIADECFFIEDSRIKRGRVDSIEIKVEQNRVCVDVASIYYNIVKKGGIKNLYENYVFESIDKALEYLRENVE